jgi:hypothetical protein
MARGLKSGYFMKRLRDGSLGYLQRRGDDCIQAAIATCLQIPIYKVPDLHIDQQFYGGKDPEEIDRGIDEKLTRFARQHSITVKSHVARLPTSGRWIGVVSQPGLYSDHCLVMDGRECLFETMGDELGSIDYGHSDIDYGITLERR